MVLLGSYIDLRPHLMTLIMAPLVLWLLYCSEDKPNYIWVVPVAICVWANVHGGFIFGIGMIFLWTACNIVESLIRNRTMDIRRNWQSATASIVAVLLAGYANPFGTTNLTEPFKMIKDNIWRNVAEWLPIWIKADFGSVWEFIMVLIIIIVLFVINYVISTISTGKKPISSKQKKSKKLAQKGNKTHQSGGKSIIAFEMILSFAAVFMGVNPIQERISKSYRNEEGYIYFASCFCLIHRL
jgi:hypothetical protein